MILPARSNIAPRSIAQDPVWPSTCRRIVAPPSRQNRVYKRRVEAARHYFAHRLPQARFRVTRLKKFVAYLRKEAFRTFAKITLESQLVADRASLVTRRNDITLSSAVRIAHCSRPSSTATPARPKRSDAPSAGAGAECRQTASTEREPSGRMRNPRYKKLIIKVNRPPRASLSNQIAR
jgi:hypothetical protein